MKAFLTLTCFSILLACSTPAEQQDKDPLTTEKVDTAINEEIFYPSGKLKMSGQTINGEKHGLWVAYFENGGVWSKNEFDHGIQHGTTLIFQKSGLTYYTGSYTNGERSGEWHFYDNTGEPSKTINYDKTD